MKFFETWGRDVEIKFLTSSGSDESAQRADVVAVKAMKPFAVFHLIVAGLDVLETELAKAKIPVMGYSTTATKANLQAPYRWGSSDAQSSAINSAEVIGKQLVGKKAEYAGDDVKQADPQVRRGLHPDARRHRQLQVVLQEVRRHHRQRELVPGERLHVR